MISLQEINNYSPKQAEDFFYDLFLSKEMAEDLTTMRPFANTSSLLSASNELWLSLPKEDQVEAIVAHPRVGDIEAALKTKYSCNEQSALCSAPDLLLNELKLLNRLYEEKFGHIYLACATGRSPNEILDYIKERLDHSAEEEFHIAKKEKMAIHAARIAKISDHTDFSNLKEKGLSEAQI